LRRRQSAAKHSDWHLKGDEFDLQRITGGWRAKLSAGLAQSYFPMAPRICTEHQVNGWTGPYLYLETIESVREVEFFVA
jgi:hypothetical protein